MHEAGYYTNLSPGLVRCELCPHQCTIAQGERGVCKVRHMSDNVLYTDAYGKLSSVALDPVEKKPIYHWHPGSAILSIGSVGCNLECKNCQNEKISQCIGIDTASISSYTAEEISLQATKNTPPLLAFTYNEPTVFYEFMADIAQTAIEKGVECAMITNGYIMQDPLRKLLPIIEAFNVDLKAFNNDFYKSITGGSLRPVLRSLDQIKNSGAHLEISYLIIPGLNDDPAEFGRMIEYLRKTFGRSQVLHLTRYFPKYKLDVQPTPLSTIDLLMGIAQEELDFVYPGNTGNEMDANTYCPVCGHLLIQRINYHTRILGIRDGSCDRCNEKIYGKFN